MLTRIIEFSVRNNLIIGLFVIALLGYGSYQVTRLPVDAVPDITNNQIQVITTAPSFGATDIERLVTFPIEQATGNIPGMTEMRSFSRFGLSLVTIVFEDDIDIYWARQQVAERLQQVQNEIPKGIGTPTLGPISSGLGEIYQYVIRPKEGYEQKYDVTQLRTVQDWIVRRQLLGVKGVAEVSSFGGKLKQFEIAINPDKLNASGLTIQDVYDAVEASNQNTGGSYIEKGPTVLYIRTEGLLKNIDDIGNIAIATDNHPSPVFVRDIAKIRTGYATRFGALCYNDEGEVAGGIVMMLKGANSSQVIKDVKARVAEIQKTLPEGLVIEPFLDRTKMVDNAIRTVETNLLEGALIVLFVLVLLLGNLRAGLLVASVIPLSMLFAISMMNAFGVSGNLMSLGALDFGLIVDGAVIIVEAVMHKMAPSKTTGGVRISKKEMDKTVIKSASKMMNSAVFGQIIILIVYLPIFALEGIEGKMFKPMAQTVAFALMGAFILSLTYIPMMSAFFLSKKTASGPNFSDRIMNKLENYYQAQLKQALRIPKIVLGVTAALFVAAVILMTNMGGEFIPELEEGDFAVDTRVLAGSNLNVTIEHTQKAAHVLLTRFPEVEKVVTKIGSGEVPTDPMPMEASDLMVILKHKDEWTSAKTFDELADKMRKALEDVPGITVGFQFPVQMRFNELMTGARQDVVVKIFGENLDSLARSAADLGKIASSVPGAINIYVEPVTGIPQVIVEYDRNSIAQYGLSIAHVNDLVNTAFAGKSAGLVFEDEKRFELVLRLDQDQRRNLEDIRNLLIPTPSGQQIRLSQVANVDIKDGPNQIQREDAKRRIVVGFNVQGRDVQTIVNELQAKVGSQLKLPTGYYVTYGGAFENLNHAKDRLMIAVPVALILIFILLFFAFGSVRHGLLIYTAIPLSAIGGIYFLALRGMPFSISAGVGFIALFGVAVLNGIVLIAEFNRYKKEGMTNLTQIVLRGTRTRLRPVLMTALVASLGFLPMALSNGAGAEVQRPLATVVIGGLVVATLLTLFILPILYIMFERGVAIRPNTGAAVIIALLFSVNLQAQQRLTLEQALELAVKNNQSVKSEKLKADYRKMLTRSAADIPQTQVLAEVGQINSAYSDSKFGIAQSLSMPWVYKRQRKVLDEEWKLAVMGGSLRELEIKKAVTQGFYQYLVLEEREKLLQQADSLYGSFFEKADLRLQTGESNVLEKSTAETQQAAVSMQLHQVRRELEVLRLELQLLLNQEEAFVPKVNPKVLQLQPGESQISHLSVQMLDKQREVAKAQISAEKARLSPEVTVGFYNNSFRGIGPDEKLYGAGDRFSSVQFGLGIPVFATSQRARIRAAKVAAQVADADYEQGRLSMNAKIRQLTATHQELTRALDYFKSSGLQNAQTISRTAQHQFDDGEINFLDYVLLVNQSLSISSNYLDTLEQLNQITIELNYLSSHE